MRSKSGLSSRSDNNKGKKEVPKELSFLTYEEEQLKLLPNSEIGEA